MLWCKLNNIMKARKLNINKISNKTKIGRTALNGLVNNDGKGVLFNTVKVLCHELKITPCDLFGYVPVEYEVNFVEWDFDDNGISVNGFINFTFQDADDISIELCGVIAQNSDDKMFCHCNIAIANEEDRILYHDVFDKYSMPYDCHLIIVNTIYEKIWELLDSQIQTKSILPFNNLYFDYLPLDNKINIIGGGKLKKSMTKKKGTSKK